jgi:diacylglycerol kinase (ATP)
MNILTIVNPHAAKGKTLRLLPKIKTLLSRNGHRYSWAITQTPEEMVREITTASSRGKNAVFLVGGDGTVHDALPAIRETRLPLGLIPCGRGNDFARNIGLTLDLEKDCAIPASPRFHSIDLPTINGVPFGSIACTGFDAVVNKLARDKRGYFDGAAGYIICVIKALKTFIPFEAEIRVDGFTWSGTMMMAAAANAPFYGGGMKIAPAARVDDGLLHVCIIEKISKWELLRQFPRVFKGTHTGHPNVIMASGRNVTMSCSGERDIFADGEFVGTTPAVAAIGAQTIQIIKGENNNK